jgi:nucleoside-diphosphate-sugar epimerase
MRVLVTGGAGFIGSHLCDFLFKKSHSLVVIDDLSSGDLGNLNSIIKAIDFYQAKLEEFDFTQIGRVDAVIHLAAQVSVPVSIVSFRNSSSTNLLGSISVLDFCRKHDIPLVYASSSAIYGNLALGDDESKKIDLLSPYAVDKYVMEIYAKAAFKLYGFSSIGLRFFNVYGPRQDPTSPYSGVISIFVDRLINRKSIVINGGHQTRDFVYVDDVVNCLYRSLEVCLASSTCEQINVLTGYSVSIDELVTMLSKDIMVDIDKIYEDLPEGDPEQSNGTTDKMVRVLGIDLHGMVRIAVGLSKTIKFIRS